MLRLHPIKSYVVGVMLAVLSLITSAESGTARSCGQNSLPPPVQKVLSENFSAWRILQLNDLSSEYQEFWLKSKHSKECPGIAIGHFEAKAILSYALSLIPQDPRAHGLRIVVVSKGERGEYQHALLQKEDEPRDPFVIYKVDPGKYSDWEDVKSVQITLDGIQAELMERSAILFYWKKGRYHERS